MAGTDLEKRAAKARGSRGAGGAGGGGRVEHDILTYGRVDVPSLKTNIITGGGGGSPPVVGCFGPKLLATREKNPLVPGVPKMKNLQPASK